MGTYWGCGAKSIPTWSDGEDRPMMDKKRIGAAVFLAGAVVGLVAVLFNAQLATKSAALAAWGVDAWMVAVLVGGPIWLVGYFSARNRSSSKSPEVIHKHYRN